MQSEPFGNGDPNNRPPQANPNVPGQKSGNGCVTCLLIFLGVGFLCIILTCAGGYYAWNHTSYPLQAMKFAIESSGDVKIEGLSGSLSSGIHFDALKFRQNGNWSSLNDIDFFYDQGTTKRGTEKLIIEKATIGSGEIFWSGLGQLQFKENSTGNGIDFSGNSGGANNTPATNPNGQNGNVADFEIQILQVKDLKFVDPDSDFEFTIDEVTLTGFDVEEGAVIGLNDFVIMTEYIELQTKPTTRFKDLPPGVIQKQFVGKISSEVHPDLVGDVSFDVHSAFEGPGQGRYDATLFDGKMISTGNGEESSAKFNDFSVGDYLKTKTIVPSHMTGELQSKLLDKSKQEYEVTIKPGAKFHLGETQFELKTDKFKYDRNTPKLKLNAEASVDGEIVQCELHMNKSSVGFGRISLSTDSAKNTPELYSKVVYGKSFDELDEKQQLLINASIKPAKKVRQNGQPSDSGSPEEGGENSETTAESADSTASDTPGTEENNAETGEESSINIDQSELERENTSSEDSSAVDAVETVGK